MRILSITGARPQFIKATVLSQSLHSQNACHILLHTGQHYDENMSGIFFEELEISKPHHYLGIGSLSHGAQTGRMLEGIEKVLLEEKPDWVVVYGDTNSTLAGALAAVKLHFPLAHIESGLRSYNRKMPEEINRVLTDHTSDILFTPTRGAVENLLKEGIDQSKIYLVGDVMYDAALYYGEKALERSSILEKYPLEKGRYILATIHRAENTDNPRRLESIFKSFALLSREVSLVIPLHPRTRKILEENESLKGWEEKATVLEPLGYLDMIMLERNARLIVTDSGGVQKEAFFYKVPCITLRDETEWTELVQSGWNRLVPPENPEEIREIVGEVYSSFSADSAKREDFYGDGKTGEKIVHVLLGGEN